MSGHDRLEVRINGSDLPYDDPLRQVIQMALDVRSLKQYVTLEVIHEAGWPVHIRRIENIKVGCRG